MAQESSLEEKVTGYVLPEDMLKKREVRYYYDSKSKKLEIYASDQFLLDGKLVVMCNSYMLGKGLLGVCFTYSGLIMMLDGLKGEDRERVLSHEKHHREHPMDNEETVREKTGTVGYTPNTLVSYSK